MMEGWCDFMATFSSACVLLAGAGVAQEQVATPQEQEGCALGPTPFLGQTQLASAVPGLPAPGFLLGPLQILGILGANVSPI